MDSFLGADQSRGYRKGRSKDELLRHDDWVSVPGCEIGEKGLRQFKLEKSDILSLVLVGPDSIVKVNASQAEIAPKYG